MSGKGTEKGISKLRFNQLIKSHTKLCLGDMTSQNTIPRHLLTTDDAEMLKNVVLHSVATAFASIVCKFGKWLDYKKYRLLINAISILLSSSLDF